MNNEKRLTLSIVYQTVRHFSAPEDDYSTQFKDLTPNRGTTAVDVVQTTVIPEIYWLLIPTADSTYLSIAQEPTIIVWVVLLSCYVHTRLWNTSLSNHFEILGFHIPNPFNVLPMFLGSTSKTHCKHVNALKLFLRLFCLWMGILNIFSFSIVFLLGYHFHIQWCNL